MTQKQKILHFFTYISSTSTPFQKHFPSLYRATPRATFHVLVAKVYVVTGAHYVTKSKNSPLCLSITGNAHSFLNFYPNKTCNTLLQKASHELQLVLLHISHIKSHSGSGYGFVSKFSLLCNFVNTVHRNMYDTSK